MVYIAIPYIPDGPVTKALKRTLKTRGVKYRLGYLGELMDENYDEAIKHHRLRYRPKHLKKLKFVDENPEVVDIAFEVLADLLYQKKIVIPDSYLDEPPYYPDVRRLMMHVIANAAIMTLAITLFVLYVQNVALMTTLIVLVSLIGAVVFIYSLTKCVIYVPLDGNVP